MRVCVRELVVLALVLWLSGSSTGARADEPVDPVLYESTLAEAITAFKAGRYEHARELFVDAHRLYPNARTLRGMGVASFELGHFADAYRDLQAALVDPERPLEDELRDAVSKLVLEAQARIGSYRLTVFPESAWLTLDDSGVELGVIGTELMLDEGEHRLRLRAEGYVPDDFVLRVTGGEDAVLRVRLAVAPEPVRVTRADEWQADAEEPPVSSPRARSRHRRLTPVASTFTVLAVVAAGGALGLWIGQHEPDDVIVQSTLLGSAAVLGVTALGLWIAHLASPR